MFGVLSSRERHMKTNTLNQKDREIQQETLVASFSQLAIENMKMNILVQSLALTVASLNIEIAKVKGEIDYV